MTYTVIRREIKVERIGSDIGKYVGRHWGSQAFMT
jgi:hypothetical protein